MYLSREFLYHLFIIEKLLWIFVTHTCFLSSVTNSFLMVLFAAKFNFLNVGLFYESWPLLGNLLSCYFYSDTEYYLYLKIFLKCPAFLHLSSMSIQGAYFIFFFHRLKDIQGLEQCKAWVGCLLCMGAQVLSTAYHFPWDHKK